MEDEKRSAEPSAGPPEPTIRLAGLEKRFGANVVLDGLNLDIAEGESVVLVGPSGTGKSVLLKHIIGLIRPDGGQVIVDGTDIWSLSEQDLNVFRRRFGMSFQEGALFDSMTVYENIAFPLKRQTKKSPAEIRERVGECLELVHLEGVETKKPAELSGGMRRRVGFARAIALEPQILLFDEPTTGLDPIMTDVIDSTIVEMRERLRSTSVTITHNMESASKIGDRIAMIYGGKIVADAAPAEFMKTDNPLVRQFVEGRAEGPMTQDTWKRTGTEKGVPA
ncbi:MAG TPA: ABC transporter ATP-binding protein [Thermoanaerobaculia bacterium]|nr:ABC transporter ATP-binding protein [Thermoanaerobaculia bacterium]